MGVCTDETDTYCNLKLDSSYKLILGDKGLNDC